MSNEVRYFHLIERLRNAFWNVQLLKLRCAWGKYGNHRQYPIGGTDGCLSHLEKEVSELKDAVRSGDRWSIEKECADVANIALMIYDLANLQCKSRPLSWIDEGFVKGAS